MSRSLTTLPNNSGTTSITEVYSATGFSAGDPVYFQNGDYKNPANLTAPSAVNFNFTPDAAINPLAGGGIVAPAFTYTQMQTGVFGGTCRRFAAVLTNGNIVQAWSNSGLAPTNPNCTYFRVVDSSGTVVVSPTVVSTTFTASTYSTVSVVALTGGGFAVSWVNQTGGTANSINYAIYSNAGSLVTAATQDTSFALGGAYTGMEMTPLANGGFAIAAKDVSNQIFLRAYSSTGVGAYTTITVGFVAAANENSFALTSRSDSSVFICDRRTGINYNYAIYSSVGAAIVGSTSFNIVSSVNVALSCGGPDACVLSDGTTIVIGFNGNNGSSVGYPAFRFLPTGNTLSAETIAIPIANSFYQTTYSGGYLSVMTLSAGGFAMIFSDGYGNMQYAFYNSSGVPLSGSNTAGAIPLQITGGYCAPNNRVTLFESSGSVFAYWTSSSNQQKPPQQFFCKISSTAYSITPISFTTGSTYTVTGQPTGAYIPSTVNPNSLSYYSSTSTSNVATNTPATVAGPTIISATTCDSIASCALPNGNFVVAWRTQSPYTIYATVYSPTGTLVTTGLVGTSSDGTAFNVKVAALSGGGFVVAYGSNNTTLNLAVYSSAYALTTSTTLTMYSFGTSYQYDVAGMLGNNFVLGYSVDGSNGRARVYNSSLTNLQEFDYGSNPQGIAVCGNSWGGFSFCAFHGGAGSTYGRAYYPTGTNTWATIGIVSTGALNAVVQSPQLVTTQSGMNIYTGYNSGYPSYFMFTNQTAAVPYTQAMSSWPLGSGSNPTSYPMMGMGITGNGNVVMATSYASSFLGIACLPAQMTFSTGQPLPYNIIGTSNVTMFSKNGYSSSIVYDLASQVRITPGVGNNCILTFKGLSQYPTFMIVNGTSTSTVYSVVAGSTPSALVPIAPATTSSNITGVLAGIAVTSATAGSTGQLAVGGQVLLGSSYTSTATGAFDSTGAAVSGVKGTFNGRSVNIQGNT